MLRVMSHYIGLLAGLSGALLAGCAPHVNPTETTAQKIVSLDFCADQYALELLPRENILALSPDAASDFSYHKARAADIPTIRPRAEDILALKPDLIIRSYGGGPQAERLFKAAGIPVVNIGWASTLEGEAAGSVSAVTLDVAQALGAQAAGARLMKEYNQRLAALKHNSPNKPSALYMTPAGVTTGSGSLVHDMIELAGFENFETRAGWHPIPLERLTRETPDHIITSFFDSHDNNTANWSSMRHPVATRALNESHAIALKGAWTSCGAWFLLDAVETMKAAKEARS